MKILVTGGAGYIGSHAVYFLIEKKHDVIIIDNLSKGFESNIHPKAKKYIADIRDEKTLNQIFEKEQNIDAIMHFAGLVVVSESMKNPIDFFSNNTHGVEVLLKIASKYKVKNFVFSSTAAVYGKSKNPLILETNNLKPINPYGDSKLAAESIIKWWAKSTNSNFIIFRYFNVAGAHKNEKIGVKGKTLTHLLPSVITSAINETEFVVMGTEYDTPDGSCVRDFIHVVDLVEAHIIGLEWMMKNNSSEIFNLGSGKGYSVLEVLNKSIKILDINIPNILGPKREGDPAILCANTEKAAKILNWKPKHSLEEIIFSEYKFRKKL